MTSSRAFSWNSFSSQPPDNRSSLVIRARRVCVPVPAPRQQGLFAHLLLPSPAGEPKRRCGRLPRNRLSPLCRAPRHPLPIRSLLGTPTWPQRVTLSSITTAPGDAHAVRRSGTGADQVSPHLNMVVSSWSPSDPGVGTHPGRWCRARRSPRRPRHHVAARAIFLITAGRFL